MAGNQALALGALAAGCRFFAGYPITRPPIYGVPGQELPKVGGAVVQAEDEIAAINMIIGASFAGAPSMTATSGPGLALMIEAWVGQHGGGADRRRGRAAGRPGHRHADQDRPGRPLPGFLCR